MIKVIPPENYADDLVQSCNHFTPQNGREASQQKAVKETHRYPQAWLLFQALGFLGFWTDVLDCL